MDQGDVYHVTDFEFPNRSGTGNEQRDKFVVLMQGGAFLDRVYDVAVLVASTYRPTGNALRPFEVLVGTTEGFAHDTVLDARWPFTISQQIITTAGEYKFTLPQAVMSRVSVALVRGLQMQPPPRQAAVTP